MCFRILKSNNAALLEIFICCLQPFTKVTSPLGSSAVRRVGSSPTTRTKMNTIRVSKFFIETRMVSYSESPAVQGFLLFLCIAYVYRETSKMRRCFYMPALLYEHGFLI